MTVKDKVFQEVQMMPVDKMEELYDFIHYFRLGLEKSENEMNSTLSKIDIKPLATLQGSIPQGWKDAVYYESK